MKHHLFIRIGIALGILILGFKSGQMMKESSSYEETNRLDVPVNNRSAPQFQIVRTYSSPPIEKTISDRELNKLILKFEKIKDASSFKKELDLLSLYPFTINDHRLSLAFQALFYQWGCIDPQAALNEIIKLNKGMTIIQEPLIISTFQSWINKNPKEAFDYMVRDDNRLRSFKVLFPLIAKEWGKSPFSENIERLSSLDYNEQQITLPAYFESLLDHHPSEATSFMELLTTQKDLPSDPMEVDKEQLKKLITLWTAKDAGTVLQWIQTLPENWRNEALLPYILKLNEIQPQETLTLLDLLPETYQQTVLSDLCTQTFARGPESQIMPWIRSLIESNHEDILLKSVHALIYSKEPQTLSTIIDQLEKGNFKDKVILNFIQTYPDYYSSEALDYLDKIQNNDLKEQAQKSIKN